MKHFSAFLLLACSVVCFAQAPQLMGGSTVFIEPMGGYETYLAAAFMKRNVPLVVVTDKAKADFVITSAVSHKGQAQPAVVINNRVSATANANSDNGSNDAWNQGWALGAERAQERRAHKEALGSTSVSISIVDPRSSQIVFAYSAGKEGTNQFQKTAEACAKNLKEFIDKSEKPKK